MAEEGTATVSSETLAEASGVNSAKVRKDLSFLGSYGTRGVGYDVPYLIHQIRRELGLTQHWNVLIAGIGNLGHALANYKGFGERGFQVVALVDSDPRKAGAAVAGLEIRPVAELASLVEGLAVAIGLICTPAASAQAIADAMVASGIRSILNFAPAIVSVPEGVSVRKVDLSLELQILSFYEQRKAGLASLKRGGRLAEV
jgi:redox-sensing transcriptional repressor